MQEPIQTFLLLQIISHLANFAILLVFCLLIFGTAAKSIGYSGFLWTFTSALALYSNPFTLLYLLGSLPNKKLEQERKASMISLVAKLEKAGITTMSKNSNIPHKTIGDESTLE